MPESKPVQPLDELLAQRYVAELLHRAQEREMLAAVQIAAARIIGSAVVGGDAAFNDSLERFCAEARIARSQIRASQTVKAMIDRARGGGHAR